MIGDGGYYSNSFQIEAQKSNLSKVTQLLSEPEFKSGQSGKRGSVLPHKACEMRCLDVVCGFVEAGSFDTGCRS